MRSSNRTEARSASPAVATRWAVVLAAGDGRRVRGLTLARDGREVPKQFWAPPGEVPLLTLAIRRAARLAGLERTLAVVSAAHEEFWKDLLSGLPPENVIVQPMNKGTAAGFLLPYVRILQRDPNPLVFVMPSDHYVADERVLGSAMRSAADIAARASDRAVLLGIEPMNSANEYGWIVASTPYDGGPAWNVRGFTEKPDPRTAQNLARSGALISSMIFVATRRALSLFFSRSIPSLAIRFMAFKDIAKAAEGSLLSFYNSLRSSDLSRDVLAPCTDLMLVLPVAGAGWIDLGTPERLLGHIRRTVDGIATGSLGVEAAGG